MRRNILVFATAAALVAGCTGDGGTNGANDAAASNEANGAATDVSEGNTSAPAEVVQIALERANPVPEAPSDSFTISNVASDTGVGGPFITADVNHSGCPPYEYKAYWNGSWTRSDPPEMAIRVRFGAAPGGCRPDVPQTVQINLREAADEHQRFWAEVHGGGGQPHRVDVRTHN